MLLAIGGNAGLGGSLFPTAWYPATAGFSAGTSSPIYGAAVFGSALSVQQLGAHYQAFQAVEALADPASQVPEPGTLMLFGTGTMATVLARRRQRS